MTLEEYNKRLKEDEFFEDFDKHYEYRFPVVAYYLEKIKIQTNRGIIFIILQDAISEYQKCLVIQAFYKIKSNKKD